MASSIVQVFGSDPTPSNIGDIAGNRFVAVTNTPTTATNTLWCICCIANFSSNVISSVKDSVNGSWTQLDIINGRDVAVNDALSVGSFYFPNAASIPAGFKGTATGGSTTTIVCTGAGWTTNQWVGLPVLNYSNGDSVRTVASNTNDTITLTTTAFSTANGNLFVVGGWVEIGVSGNDDFDASSIVEVTGVTSTPLLGHHAGQASLTAGTDNVTSGNAALGSSPCIILGLSIASENLTSVPATGTGNTSQATVWKWDQAQFNARIQFRNVSNPGTTGSNFSALSTDFYQTVMVAFLDSGGVLPPLLTGQAWM